MKNWILLPLLAMTSLGSAEVHADWTGEVHVAGSHTVTGVGGQSDLPANTTTNNSSLPVLRLNAAAFRHGQSDMPVGLILDGGAEMNTSSGVLAAGRFGAGWGFMVPGRAQLSVGGEAEFVAYRNGLMTPSLALVGKVIHAWCSSEIKRNAVCLRLGVDLKLGIPKMQVEGLAQVYYTHRGNRVEFEIGPQANATAYLVGGIANQNNRSQFGSTAGGGVDGLFGATLIAH